MIVDYIEDRKQLLKNVRNIDKLLKKSNMHAISRAIELIGESITLMECMVGLLFEKKPGA